MSQLEIGALLAALRGHEVRHVLVGAVALAAHGPVRATADVDLVPDPDPENLRRLGNALVELNARLASDERHTLGPDERHALAQGQSLTLETDRGGLDVVQADAGIPSYAELAGEASEMDLLGSLTLVCSRRHLRQMKLSRGTTRDLADVEDLDALYPPSEGGK